MTKESLNSSRTPSDGHLADTNPNSAQTLAASCSQPVLTLSQGAPVSDTASSQTLGQNGPVLLQDVDFIEKLAHFDRERIPERVVHAKGSGAFGTFRPYRSMRDYTSAAFLQDPSVSTRFLIRFSTVIGSNAVTPTAIMAIVLNLILPQTPVVAQHIDAAKDAAVDLVLPESKK